MIWVALTTTTPVARAAPKFTAVAPVRSVPVIVTAVPPVSGPAEGEMPVMVGATAAEATDVGTNKASSTLSTPTRPKLRIFVICPSLAAWRHVGSSMDDSA